MNHQDLIELARNPNFISGVHNYCDRWCERCPLTSRCIVYAQEQEDPDRDENLDINNEKFWRKLSAIYKETREMITAWAEENGVDLSPATLAKAGAESKRKNRIARRHPLAKAAEAYAFSVKSWFEQEFTMLQVTSDNLTGQEELQQEVDDFADALDIINWYQFFIAVKLMRGLYSRQSEDDVEEYPKDSHGSVKIALIAIDRSIAAWRLLQLHRPDLSQPTVKFVLALEKLRLEAEKEFPEARDFIRPGFDEPAGATIN